MNDIESRNKRARLYLDEVYARRYARNAYRLELISGGFFIGVGVLMLLYFFVMI